MRCQLNYLSYQLRKWVLIKHDNQHIELLVNWGLSAFPTTGKKQYSLIKIYDELELFYKDMCFYMNLEV